MKKQIMAAALVIAGALTTACTNSGTVDFTPTKQDKEAVMTIEGREVEYQEFRYYFLNNKRDSLGNDSVPTDEETAYLLALTEDNVRNRHGLVLFAEKYGVSVTDADIKAANEYVDEYRSSNFQSDEDYLLALSQGYLTDDLFRSLQSESFLAYTVLEKMKDAGEIPTSDEDIEKAFRGDDIICLKEIYVSYNSEETKDAANARAEEALSKLMGGAEFEELMSEYSDYNPAELPPEHGYYTMKYDALDVIWDTASELAEGEHSYVIESEYGFHIIKRCPKDYGYMEENRDRIYENYTYAKFGEKFYPFMESLTVEYTEAGKAIDPDAIN